MEILITLLIVIASCYILFKSIKKKSKGCSDCSGCQNKCDEIKLKK